MKAWLGRLSLRYKLTLSALAVEAVMLSLLIMHGVQLTTQTLQNQAERRMLEIARTLEAALLAPLAQQDDASVRDLIETLLQTDGLKMIAVRDSNNQIVHPRPASAATHTIFIGCTPSRRAASATAKWPSCCRAASSRKRVPTICATVSSSPPPRCC